MYARQSDRSTVAINCTAVENTETDSLYQRSELDCLIWNDPTAYTDLFLNGDPHKSLHTVAAYRLISFDRALINASSEASFGFLKPYAAADRDNLSLA